MKNMIKLFAVAAIVALTSIGLASTGADAKSSKCDAISYKGRDAKNNYTVSGNTATIKFKVIGPKNCKQTVTIISWKSPSRTGAPFNKQTVYQKKTQTFTKGENRRLSIQLPSCFYQVDTITGTNIYGRTGQPHLYGSRMVGYKLGGTKSCTPPAPKTIKVCDLATKKIVTIKEGEYNTTKYSKNLDDCKVTPTPKQIEVCELATKKIITIDETKFDATKHSNNLNDCAETPEPNMVQVCELDTKTIVTIEKSAFDSTKHSYDLNDCKEVPVTPETPVIPEVPVEETPEELPQTGPADAILKLFGAASLAGASAYYAASRRQ